MNKAPHLLLMPPNWIGDVIMAQPAMQAIADYYRRQHGTEQITISGRPWLKELVPYLGLAHAEYAAAIPKADIAYLFPNSFRVAWQCRKAGVGRIIGYRGQWRRALLSQALPHRISLRHEHHREFYLDIARQTDIPVAHTDVTLQCPDDAVSAGKSLMQQHGIDPERAICIAPGAQFGGAKCYPADAYSVVVRELAASGWQPIILGIESDRAVGETILDALATPHWNAAGTTTLATALQLIAASRMMLCNDSGLMHVAAGLGIATLAPFGATDPARTAPSGPRVRILFKPAECSPCLQRECSVKGHPCMRNISPQMLLSACRDLLDDDLLDDDPIDENTD